MIAKPEEDCGCESSSCSDSRKLLETSTAWREALLQLLYIMLQMREDSILDATLEHHSAQTLTEKDMETLYKCALFLWSTTVISRTFYHTDLPNASPVESGPAAWTASATPTGTLLLVHISHLLSQECPPPSTFSSSSWALRTDAPHKLDDVSVVVVVGVVVVTTPLPMNRFNAWFLRFFFWILWPQQEGGHDEIFCAACQLCTGAASAEFIELLSENFLYKFYLKNPRLNLKYYLNSLLANWNETKENKLEENRNKNERLLEGKCNNGSHKENPRRSSTRYGAFQIRASSKGGGLLFRVRSFVSAIADFLVATLKRTSSRRNFVWTAGATSGKQFVFFLLIRKFPTNYWINVPNLTFIN